MSEFSHKILDAKHTQQKFIFKITLAVFLLFLISILCFFYIYSKRIVTNPNVNNYYVEFKNGKGLVLFKRILFLSDKIKRINILKKEIKIIIRDDKWQEVIKKYKDILSLDNTNTNEEDG